MTLADDVINEILVPPGKKADLHHRDTAWKGGKTFEDMATDDVKAFSRERLQQFIDGSRPPRSCCGPATPTRCWSCSRRSTRPARTAPSST